MKQYLDLERHILEHGEKKSDRTGTGTIGVFGHQMRFNLASGFPLVTTKKLHLKSIIYELLWFLRGEMNIRWLQERGVTIWDEWADANGDIGPAYGEQWRTWPNFVRDSRSTTGNTQYRNEPIDQITEAVEMLKKNPDSRRIIVTAWNPSDVPKMKLPSCHCFFQFYVANGKLYPLRFRNVAELSTSLNNPNALVKVEDVFARGERQRAVAAARGAAASSTK